MLSHVEMAHSILQLTVCLTFDSYVCDDLGMVCLPGDQLVSVCSAGVEVMGHCRARDVSGGRSLVQLGLQMDLLYFC